MDKNNFGCQMLTLLSRRMLKHQTAYKIKWCANTMPNCEISHTQCKGLNLIINFSLPLLFLFNFMLTVINEYFSIFGRDAPTESTTDDVNYLSFTVVEAAFWVLLQYVRDYMRHQCLTRLRSSYICIVLQRCMLLNG